MVDRRGHVRLSAACQQPRGAGRSEQGPTSVVTTSCVDNLFLVGGAYIAHFAMYTTLENRTHGKKAAMCAPPRLFVYLFRGHCTSDPDFRRIASAARCAETAHAQVSL